MKQIMDKKIKRCQWSTNKKKYIIYTIYFTKRDKKNTSI